MTDNTLADSLAQLAVSDTTAKVEDELILVSSE